MNVIINGDKTQFISKNAICRLKKDLKENIDQKFQRKSEIFT